LTSRPRGGHYPLAVILLALDLVRLAGLSLRAAAAALAILAQHGYGPAETPSASTIRLWLIRLGCACLSRPLPAAGPWVWLVDHTLQIGPHKLLVILGCPLSRVPFGQRPLAFADVELIAAVAMTASNQELVDDELEKATARTGIPAEIVSDDGSDLRGGIRRFQQRHGQTRSAVDVAHAAANLLKHYRENDARWQQFTQQMHQTAATIRQTSAAYLLAPKVRGKARYMNVAVYVRFGRLLLRHLQMAQPRQEVLKHYGWVLDFARDIGVWDEQHACVQVLLAEVREQGLFSRSRERLEEQWQALALSEEPTTQRLLNRLRGYVTRHTAGLKPGERLVGSTEILESLFGVLKRLSGEQAQSGLTSLTLSLGALVGTHTPETVRQDLEAVPEKQAQGWAKRLLGRTVQWLRRQFARVTNAGSAEEQPPEPVLG